MKLIDAIKEKGNPFYIPDCSRDDLPEFFKQVGLVNGVEIGVSHGANMELYCKAGLNMCGVDPWLDYEDHQYRKIVSLPRHLKHDTIEDIYHLAQMRLGKYPNCTLIRKMSMDALADFPKRSLDFVYIDGNHGFGYVAMDLWKWMDKIKRGGIMAGHDYYNTKGGRMFRAVGHVVDAYVRSHDITNWYVLGRKEIEEGERRDLELSFMFYKHW